MPSRKSAPDPENIDPKEVQFFTPATAGRNRTKTCDPRQLVALKNFTEAIFEILIFPDFFSDFEKSHFFEIFRDPGKFAWTSLYTPAPPRGDFSDFFEVSQVFSTQNAAKGCPRTYVDAEFHGGFISDGFRTIPDRLDTQK